MHYYRYHIGDFRAGTVNLCRQERWIYRDLLDIYYDSEAPLPDACTLFDALGLESEQERAWLDGVLRKKFTRTEQGHTNARCIATIAEFHAWNDARRENGRKGGRRKPTESLPTSNLLGTELVPASPLDGKLTTNHYPLTTNQYLYTATFLQFWSAYPNTAGKQPAAKAFAKLSEADQHAAIAALPSHCQQDQWKRDGGKFIPHASKWLNQELFRDDVIGTKAVVDTRPDWCVQAGFANIYEANNARCFEHNAHMFTDGQKVVAA